MSSVGAPPPHWIGSGSDGSRGGEPPRSSSPSPYAQQMQYMPGQPGFPPYRPMPMPPPQMGGPPLSITRSSPNMSPSLQGAVMRPLPPPPPPHFMPGMPAPPPGMMMRPMPPPQMMPFMPPTLIRGQPPPRPHMMMGAPPPPPWMMGRPPLGPPPPGGFLPPATTTRRGSVGEGSVSNGHPFTSHSDIEDNHSAGSDPQAGDAPNHPDDDSSNKENVEVSLSGLSLKGSGDMRSSVTSMASSDGRPNSIGATPELTGLQSGSERNSVASFNSVGGGNPLPPPPPPPPGFQFPPGAMMMRPAPPPGTAFPAGPGAPPPPPPGFPIGASPYPAFPGMIRPMHPGPPPPTVARVNSFPTLAAPDFDAASVRSGRTGGFDSNPGEGQWYSDGATADGESLDSMRQRAKVSNDPEFQLTFAKQLIVAAEELVESDPDPKKVKRNQDLLHQESLRWIKKLAAPGGGRGAYPEAMFFLAECYGNGSLGLTVDHDKAFGLYLQASKQNHPGATYRSAVCYEVGAGTKRDHARAVQFYRKAATLSDTAAMYKYGMVLLGGLLNVAKNPREGVTWLKRAANQADATTPHALHELGVLYEGKGDSNGSILPDPQYAHDLFLKAAQLGYSPSQYKLGLCYEYGHLGLPVDPRRSIAWYTRAAEQGDPEAELALSGWYLTGADGVLRQSDTEAYLWARKAADKGLAKAEYAVGYYVEHGVGVRADVDDARRWYLRAAGQGNKRAIQRLKELKGYAQQAQDKSRKGDWRKDGDASNGDCSVM